MKMDWSGLCLDGHAHNVRAQVVVLLDRGDVHQQVGDVDQIHVSLVGELRDVQHLQEGVVLPVAR